MEEIFQSNVKKIHFWAEYFLSETYCDNLESSDVVEENLTNILINITGSNVAVHVLRGEIGSRRLIFNGLTTTEAEYIKTRDDEVSIQL